MASKNIKHVDLSASTITADLAAAPIYAKSAVVRAWQMTPQARALLMEHGGSDLYDIFVEGEELMLRTFVMVGEGAERHKKEETVRRLDDGDWVVLNPAQQEGDYPNRYAMGVVDFTKRYELMAHSRITVDGDQFRARGMARIITNPYGEAIEIDAPWGGTQAGDADCYICATYDRDHPEEVSFNRYLLSENDFRAYKLASEVLGEDWETANHA